MEHDFWHSRWQKKQIGFHLAEANPLLVKHFSALNLTPKTPQKTSPRVFLPLCGKTLDIAWLLAQGYQVVGAELSQMAIDELFAELVVTPNITKMGDLTLYQAENLDVFVGDIFKLNASLLGKIDAVYDRAALVALPEDMRLRYTAHLLAISQHAPQLLVCFTYDQAVHAGPPFSVNAEEVRLHYQASHDLTLLATEKVEGGLKGVCPAVEQVWWLK
jgi:thiopurine S-methyltransferase